MSDQELSDSDVSQQDQSWVKPRTPEDCDLEEQEWVHVYLRLKPCNIPSNLYKVKNDRCLITSVDTATAGHGRRMQHNVSKMYTFSQIFGPDSSQKEIFEKVVKQNLRKLPEGHNFTLLAYGASGSGKTYTLMGTVPSPGLVPRSLEYVFKIVDAAQQPLYKPSEGGAEQLNCSDQAFELQWIRRLRNASAPLRREKYRRMSSQLRNDKASRLNITNRTRYYVWVSFVEIYNEGIYDLLVNTDRSKAMSKLRIREDASGNAYVKGATQAFVRSGEEAYDVMVAGKHNLQVAATGVHAHSSRSHCIFTITLLTETDSGVRSSYVRLCDLAGSERARATHNTGARMMESRSINASLHVLERCLHMRRMKQRVDATLVPYRESKLTRLLGAGLSGSEAVSMVVTLNPSPQYAQETKHVLQLAAVAKDIQVNNAISEQMTAFEPTQDTSLGYAGEMLKLRTENHRLHLELIQWRRWFSVRSFNISPAYPRLVSCNEEVIEEYKARLKNAEKSDITTCGLTVDGETHNRSLQRKIAELMAYITILEEKLANEELAHQRAKEETQHLRACIEERDEEAENNSTNGKEDTIESTSDESSEHDSYNESLEPSFGKEEIDRVKRIRKSLNMLNLENDYVSLKQLGTKKFNESILLDQESPSSIESESCNNSGHVDYVHDSVLEVSNDTLKDEDDLHNDTVTKSLDISEEMKHESIIAENDVAKTIASNNSGYGPDTLTNNATNGDEDDIHNVVDLIENNENTSDKDANSEKCHNESNIIKVTSYNSLTRGTYFVRKSQSFDSSKDLTKSTDKEPIFFQGKVPEIGTSDISTRSSTRGTYFVKESEIFNTSELDKSKNTSILSSRKTYFVKDNVILDAIVNKFVENEKSNKSLEEKVPNTSIEENILANASLAQFEQLEMAAKSTPVERLKRYDISLLKISYEKPQKYFDDENVSEPKKSSNLNEERSPSNVKDHVAENFEASTIKKLLGESLTRPEVLPIHVAVPQKNCSLNIFEGFDLPALVKTNLDAEVLNSNINVAEQQQNVPTILQIKQKIENTENLSKIDMAKTVQHNETISAEKGDLRRFKQKKIDFDFIRPAAETSISENLKQINETETTVGGDVTRENTLDEFEKIVKNVTVETGDKVDSKITKKDSSQLKDIENLQKEFSVLTLGVPVAKKVVKDILSPEKEK